MTMTHLRKRGTRYCNREVKRYPEEFKMQVAEDRDIYLANGALYVPEKTSWDYIKNANQQNIGEILDKTSELLRMNIQTNLRM
ncbi:MAG: hypothetical protein OCU17_06715 [Methanophagales archaeon]|nr:hypothetical protein [Methanophagales archaeon]